MLHFKIKKYKITILVFNEKKLKHWWSTIPPLTTKLTNTSHLNSLDIKKTIAYASCKLSHAHQFCNEMETV